MKKCFLSAAVVLAAFSAAFGENVQLPAPQTAGGLSVNQALAERRSVRQFDSARALPEQVVSNLLWAACGVNRPESGLRTNPTARNVQEIDAYWFDETGVYLYDFKANALVAVAVGDHRGLVAGSEKFKQEFVLDAPASIVLVADTAKIAMNAALIDAGIACENINLFCAGNGLATVPRMTMDVSAIQQLLSLPETSVPVINNPVGYAR